MTDGTDPTQRHPQQQGPGDSQGLEHGWAPIGGRPPQPGEGAPGPGGGMPGQGGYPGSGSGYPPAPGNNYPPTTGNGYPPAPGNWFDSQVTQPLPGLGAGLPEQQGFPQHQTGATSGYPTISGVQQGYGQPQMGYPYQAVAANPIRSPKYSKNQILAVGAALVLIVGVIVAVVLLNRSTPPATGTAETPTAAQPSPTATRPTAPASVTPSPIPTTTPITSDPAQPPGIPVIKQKLDELVFPAKVDTFRLRDPEDKVKLYESSLPKERFNVGIVNLPGPSHATEILDDPEKIPGGYCGKLEGHSLCLIEAADGVILISNDDTTLPKIKDFTLKLLTLLGG